MCIRDRLCRIQEQNHDFISAADYLLLQHTVAEFLYAASVLVSFCHFGSRVSDSKSVFIAIKLKTCFEMVCKFSLILKNLKIYITFLSFVYFSPFIYLSSFIPLTFFIHVISLFNCIRWTSLSFIISYWITLISGSIFEDELRSVFTFFENNVIRFHRRS